MTESIEHSFIGSEDGSNSTGDDEDDLAPESASQEDSEDDELQIAFKEGLLHGLNVPQPKKREPIYKKAEMISKMASFRKKRDWLDTLHVKFSPDLCYNDSVNEDFNRESTFYKQAMNAVQIALTRLASKNVPTARPSDYFAEMAKSDDQMDRVRRKLLNVQNRKERQEKAQRLREERKFAVKVQRTREEKKRKEKKKLAEATKKHKRGMKGQLEDMLKNAKQMQRMEDDDEEEPSGRKHSRKGRGGGGLGKRKISRTARDKKFGFGGQKKRSKRNDRKSFNSM